MNKSTDLVLNTIVTRIGKKSVSRSADLTKAANLERLIESYKESLEKHLASAELKGEEVEFLLDLKAEAEELYERRGKLQKYTDGLREKFDKIEWSPDLAWEDKIESTDYAEKVAERHAINDRLTEIEKLANKTYYRR